ncbi:dipeptide/oligopeptide/nickel ABC transporter permease/ATP-binding protein [Arthrobacter sp. zg-Y20]|uniref:dipeptide/oligopeptide/nickel ABC transporter permease/ATP-binding protein n=1 Tax=unclassified Arthrobacter TaxID=235627 RepID=UPI001D14328D|nr:MULTISPECIES: dipeptide/oligopeptide/nickel ABC transporter permease/ATP-binding protein [unclassified Arthrobacter]MCC3276293.1 dipeptide/oligopeptide/nickel ABC transporter permease/ATP-binding protein [Arthrobacter sp. zg-Y20]MDK1316452.1 dipeptide/oligopeptide/nickel ABC transporter permease/ATP-binding protein [Arthrobacter sp. zg.Y20]WIB06497.1 dipeptide/oligopeptide/nickel ABC transporter permease/ATP-binding protein [Arthrobacter sp. zg-Y20]
MRNGLTERLSNTGARFTALSISSKLALGFLAFIVLVAVFGPFLAPFGENESSVPVLSPTGEHFFGTDGSSYDVFSRMLYGARVSISIGLGAVALALILGAILGAIAATSRKAVSETVMRILDIMMAFPGIALAAALLFALREHSLNLFGSTVPVLILAIAIVYTPQLARVVRANVLAQYGEDYVRAERVIGAGRTYILLKHIARNCAAPVLVFATVMVADAIILEASLSFLGAGVQQPAASWGNVMADGRNVVFSGAWWPTTFGGITILLTVLALNVLAEGLTDAMVNPGTRRSKKRAAEAVATTAQPSVLDPAGTSLADSPLTASAATGTDADLAAGIAAAGIAAAGQARSDAGANVTKAGSLEALAAELELLAAAEARRSDRLPPVSDDAPVILEVKDLSIRFPERYGDTAIVDRVSFTVREGETMGLVGESGCGKSITSLAIMGLLPATARLTGSIKYRGKELLTNNPKDRDKLYRGLRGEQIAMVYQDALSSLNPSMLIKDQMLQLTRRGGRKSPRELLEMVKLDPDRTLKSYPHELSGGQRQRVLIAMALSRSPKIVVADEPTTALDVTVQKQVVDLLNELREQLGFAMVFVSHDLALVASLAHRVTVMYAGQVVESADVPELLGNPRHEYTRGLLGAVLSIEAGADRLHQIRGTVPSPKDFAPGDRFAERSLRPDADPNQVLQFVRVGTKDHFWASHETGTEAPAPAALANSGTTARQDS